MATYDPNAIRAQIKTLLQTATELSYVYDYNNPAIEGYPAAIFDITNENATMLDEAANMREITFTIYIAQETKIKGQSAAKTILDNAVKSVINLLENTANVSLGNTVDWTMPVIGRRTQVDSPEGMIMWQEIMLKCNVASTIL